MNRLTSQQRKIIYLVGIVVLLVPIIWLGSPSTGEENSGGMLPRMRTQYDLGTSDLGKVDPSSAVMNLVLLGLRGVAANLLWIEHDKLKSTKDWARMRAVTESIVTLQPHYLKVWQFHGWNLAYNVSMEWDAVEDRFYWVKEGAKFTAKGVEQNKRYPELYADMGNLLGKKIGRSDEWRHFRKFFRSDPNTDEYNGGPDSDLNRENDDNYLVARKWYLEANERELTHEQHAQARVLFRQYPTRCLLDYADALQREGQFDEVTQKAWENAYTEFTEVYGQEQFKTPGGLIRLESTNEDIERMAKEQDIDPRVLEYWGARYQNMANYRYWRTLSLAESELETVEAHRELYEGQQSFREGQVYPTRHQATAVACQQLESREISESKRTILQVLCKKNEPMTYSELAEEESIKSLFLNKRRKTLIDTLQQLAKERLTKRILCPAQEQLESGLEKFANLLERYPVLKAEDPVIQEGLTGVLYWRYIQDLNNTPLPKVFPLKALWDQQPLTDITPLDWGFRRDAGIQ